MEWTPARGSRASDPISNTPPAAGHRDNPSACACPRRRGGGANRLGDLQATREQCRAALTTIARWWLIANGEFPLSRNELSEQLLALGYLDLAATLHHLIHDEPSREEMCAGLELAEKLILTNGPGELL